MNEQANINEVVALLNVLTNAILSSKNSLTAEEAAAYLGLKVSYLYKLTSTQEIPHYKPRGKMLYFKRDELDAWSLQNRIKTTDEIDKEAANRLVSA